MKKIFGKTCLFLLASAFLFENAGFLTHELNLAVGLAFLAALGISYFPLKGEKKSAYEIVLGATLILVAVAVMPGEFTRPGALALFVLALGLLLRGFGRTAPELPLFAITAAGYGLYAFLYRADPHVWEWANDFSFGFSRVVGRLTSWLPGTKALLGPTFLGAGTIVTFALLLIVGSFFLKEKRLRRLLTGLVTVAILAAAYVVIFSYIPRALTFQLKVGPVPDEVEQSHVKQAEEQHRERKTRTESEKATKVFFSGDSLLMNNCPIWAPLVLVLLFFIPAYSFFKGAELRAPPLFGRTPFAAAGVLLLVAMAMLETASLRVPSREELQAAVSKKRVAFYYYGLANWMRPGFDQFGARSSGMFGNLPDFVEAMGFNQPEPATRDQKGYINAGVILTELTEENLKDVDILFLANVMGAQDPRMLNCELRERDLPMGIKRSPAQQARKDRLDQCKTDDDKLRLMESWYRQALRRIWKFVADGGSLVFISDHTFCKRLKLPGNRTKTKLWLNDVLEPFEIKFVNDSAKYFIGGWLQSLENPLNTLTFGMRDDHNEVGMVTGASLTASGAARPIIVGKYGFLDAGDMRDRVGNYLGNMNWDVGEPTGEIIIAAEQTYGKGKVAVFGDTGAFANGIITNCGGFCNRVFAWLAAEGGDRKKAGANGAANPFDPQAVPTATGAAETTVAIVLLVIAGICLWLAGGHAGLVAGALAVGLVVAAHPAGRTVTLGPGVHGGIRLAYVDTYHMPKISKEGWRDDGLMALHLNLMRNGFYTQNLKTFDLETLKGAELLVIVAPSVPFTGKDVKTVREFVEGGGKVILTSGIEDVPATHRLLDAFELRILDTPLGWFRLRVAAAGGKHAMFWKAWPIEYTGRLPEEEEHKQEAVQEQKQEAGDRPFWDKWPVEHTGDATAAEDDKDDEKIEKDKQPPPPFEVIIPYDPVSRSRTRFVRVENHLRVASREEPVAEEKPGDESIAAEVAAKFAADSQLADMVAVQVKGGEIILAGRLPGAEMKEKAVRLAATATGYTRMQNNLVAGVQGTPSIGRRTNKAIEEEVRAKLAADPLLRGAAIEIGVERGVVSLTGTVPRESLKEKAGNLAKTAAYLTKVYNLAVRRNVGKGSFIHVADSGFWMNKNLEVEKLMDMSKSQQEQYLDNIYFMKWFIETYIPQEKEGE